jgi:hypothetical protein
MERPAVIVTQSYAGRTEWPCMLVFGGETPKRYRVRVLQDTKLAGRNRWALEGTEVLVPKTAVRFLAQGTEARR